jgi:hypothetical protein
MCLKHLRQYEPKLARHRAPNPCIFRVLWENMYKKSYSLICDEFIARIHFILFKKECPRLSTRAKKMISKVGHWYLDERDTYIRFFEATKAPHLLLVHVPDRLVVGEIYYHTILHGYNAILVKDKKREFIPYGFHIGFYLVKDTSQDKQGRTEPIGVLFQTIHFYKHDPKCLVLKHVSQVSSSWPYSHDKFEDEVFMKND